MTKVTLTTLIPFMLLTSTAAAAQPAYDDRPKITVGGEALVNVAPDKIVITLGVETRDTLITVAKQQNNEIVKKAIAAIKDLGVPGKEIQTDRLSVQPRWDRYHLEEHFIGYIVRNTVVVTLTDVAKVEALITDVLEIGVNYIHGVSYQTTEFKKHRERARELALQAAREKAGKMAAVLDRSVGRPIQIHEGIGFWGYGSGWGGDRAMSQNMVQDMGGGSDKTMETVALGKIGIRARVSVTFELED